MKRFRPRKVTRTAETLARLDTLVEVLQSATQRLEQSAKTLDELTRRHLRALETDRGEHET